MLQVRVVLAGARVVEVFGAGRDWQVFRTVLDRSDKRDPRIERQQHRAGQTASDELTHSVEKALAQSFARLEVSRLLAVLRLHKK